MIRLAVFDLETTGVDAHNDRIVTAFVGLLGPDGTLERQQEWIVNPGVPVPAGAAEVHGWTDERLATDPRVRQSLDEVVGEIAHLIWSVCKPREGQPVLPLAGHNLGYDLTMLNAHLGRMGIAPLPFGDGGIYVLDSLVLDKHFAKFVRGTGQRKLTPTAARYGVILTEDQAHDASFDAMAAGRIVQGILGKHVRNVLSEPASAIAGLHRQQKGWYLEQQLSLEKWLRKENKLEPGESLDTDWPTHAPKTQGAAA